MKEHSFDTDIIMAPRRSEKRAWIVAGVATGVSVLMALSIATMMPLKTTEVFTVLVDRDTGDAERIMQVQPTGIEDEQAVKESLLVSYVSDRESFLMAGIQERLESVQRRSAGGARRSLVSLWSNDSDNETYPPRLYGQGAEVTVRVKTITFLETTVAQVRYEKTLRTPRQDSVTRPFVAVIGFEFQPREERALERVWENPLGFTVTSFNVSAETLGG
ncbi:virB8 family protein [Alloyangia pacifica]|uniref:virB8 family protein n=1 Tax=Alloyangia pacifica TaxID=311180 RepID=UPI001CFE6F5D|nr:type IV secretion system protein [Alloyangia pacifica]